MPELRAEPAAHKLDDIPQLGHVEQISGGEEGEDPRTPPGLLRLSVGLEHADDLIEDLARALE